MHYVIADILTKRIEIKDYNRFIFGALMPDMSSHDDGSYDIAHFGRVNSLKGIKGIDWRMFFIKYQDRILEDDFYLGYYVHLIVDAYWLKHIQNKLIRKYPKEQKAILYKKGYKDMYLYNKILIDKYNLVDNIEIIRDIKLDEINDMYIEPYFEGLRADFASEANSKVKFEIYSNDVITLFIQMVSDYCIYKIKAIREMCFIGDPEELFVKI